MAIIAKLLATILRCAQVLAALFNTGVTTYFIVGLSNRNLIDGNGKALAVEIISAAGLLWAVFALVFSICLLQKSFFQFFSVFGDLAFVGGFIAVTILLKDAFSRPCSSNNITVGWLQRGGSHLNTNCELIKGIFIVSIALCVLFFLSVFTAFLAHRASKKDRAYGPSPANNYTYGRGKRSKRDRDIEDAAIVGPALAPPAVDNRVSHESKYTDITEKTNGDLQTGTTGAAGREYLAPRGYAATDTTVSPIPSTSNLHSKEHSHAGQYAMAGALVGGAAAAHHHHKKGAYGPNDTLPNHPGPEDHTTERIPTIEDPDRLGTMNTYGTANTMYSELDNTTTTGPPSAYGTPGQYPGSRGAVQPTAFYPAAQTNANPHFYSSEMDAGGYGFPPHEPQELSTKPYEEYPTPITPVADHNRNEVGFGYGNGPGMTGGGSNQVSTLPEMGREDGRRF